MEEYFEPIITNVSRMIEAGGLPATAGGILVVVALLAVMNTVSRIVARVATIAIVIGGGYYIMQSGMMNQWL